MTSILSANLKTTAAVKMLTRRERKGGMGGGAPGLSWLYKRNLSYRQALLASPNHLVLCHSRLEVGPNITNSYHIAIKEKTGFRRR